MNAYVYIHSHREPHNVMQTLGPATRSSLPSPCNNHNLLTSWEIHCPVNQLGQPTEADCLLAIQACQLAPYSPIQLKESSGPIGTQHPSPTSTLKAQPLPSLRNYMENSHLVNAITNPSISLQGIGHKSIHKIFHEFFLHPSIHTPTHKTIHPPIHPPINPSSIHPSMDTLTLTPAYRHYCPAAYLLPGADVWTTV